jgi:hypothetical protein
MPNYNNYSISSSKGKLYLKSAEPKEGYEKVTYGTDNKITYHKYVDRFQGVLKSFVQTEATKSDGTKLHFLEAIFIDGENNNKLSVPLKNSKSNFTDEVKVLVSSLNNAEVGQNYTVAVTKNKTVSKTNGKEYENLNMYLNYTDRLGENGKGLSTGFINPNDVPKAIKDDDPDLGVTWDWKPVNRFYAQKIKEISEKFITTTSTQVFQPVDINAPKVEMDSLPF